MSCVVWRRVDVGVGGSRARSGFFTAFFFFLFEKSWLLDLPPPRRTPHPHFFSHCLMERLLNCCLKFQLCFSGASQRSLGNFFLKIHSLSEQLTGAPLFTRFTPCALFTLVIFALSPRLEAASTNDLGRRTVFIVLSGRDDPTK